MGTTLIFAEILIIGIQCVSWVLLLIFSIFGYGCIKPGLTLLSKWTAITSITFIAFSYTFGIIFDRLFDAVTKIYEPAKIILAIPWVQKKASDSIGSNRPQSSLIAGTLANDTIYLISRLRIARSTFFNLSLLFLSTIIFYLTQLNNISPNFRWKLWITTLVVGFTLVICSLISYSMSLKTYQVRIEQIVRLKEKGNNFGS